MRTVFLARFFGFDYLEKQEQIKRASLIRIVLLTCISGPEMCIRDRVYSGVYIIFFNVWESAIVTLAYVLMSFANLLIFFILKNYNNFRTYQLFFILHLPILAQLSMGGFVPSSGVGVSAVLAPIGALLFHNVKVARVLFLFFVLLLGLAGFLEHSCFNVNEAIPRSMEILFFVIVMSSSMAVVYLMLEYVIIEKKKVDEAIYEANLKIIKSKEEIQGQNQELLQQQKEILAQSDKLELSLIHI